MRKALSVNESPSFSSPWIVCVHPYCARKFTRTSSMSAVKRGETKLQQLYKSVAKEISKPPFFGS